MVVGYFIKDIFNILKMRIKLLLSNKKLVMLYIACITIVAIMVYTFYEEAEEKSSIPIGIVDLDNTKLSNSIIEEIENSDLVRVIKGSKQELNKKLKDGEIYCIFVYDKGFCERLTKLDIEGLIEDNYSSEKEFTKVISDVALASIIDEISFLYSERQYYINQNKFTDVFEKKEYEDYIRNIYKTEDKTIAFDFIIMNTKTNKVQEAYNYKIEFLYKEIIFAIISLIIMIAIMLVGNIFIDDRRVGATKRFSISLMKPSSIILGDYLVTVIIGFVFSIFSYSMIIKDLGIQKLEQIVKIMLIIFLFNCTISMLFVMVSRLVKDFVSYQLAGTITILIIGVFGAVYILGFLINDSIGDIAKYTPIGMLMKGYMSCFNGESINNSILVSCVAIIIMYCISYMSTLYRIEKDYYNAMG